MIVGNLFLIANSVAPQPVCFLLKRQFAGISAKKSDRKFAPSGAVIVQFFIVVKFLVVNNLPFSHFHTYYIYKQSNISHSKNMESERNKRAESMTLPCKILCK